MNYFPKPASRTLVSLALTSTILTGCGSDSSDLSFGNTGGQNAPLAMPVVSGLPGQLSGKVGTVTITSVLLRAVVAEVTTLRFVGRNLAGQVIFGPVEFAKSPSISLQVPIEVTNLTVEYLQGSQVIGFYATPVLVLEGGNLNFRYRRARLYTDSISCIRRDRRDRARWRNRCDRSRRTDRRGRCQRNERLERGCGCHWSCRSQWTQRSHRGHRTNGGNWGNGCNRGNGCNGCNGCNRPCWSQWTQRDKWSHRGHRCNRPCWSKWTQRDKWSHRGHRCHRSCWSKWT